MPSTRDTVALLKANFFANSTITTIQTLNQLLRLMGRWRATLITNTFVQHHGVKVYSGPFKDMEYLDYATEGCLVPRLLGCYEDELHADLHRFAEMGVDTLVDIGCAEGYYAVGLARFMPALQVHAFDTDPKARSACADLAAKNGVADRIHIGGKFSGEMFEQFVDRNTLVFIDAEGFEDEIMNPELFPALAQLNIIMETHPMFRPGVVRRMQERFTPTHDIKVHYQKPKTLELPEWLQQLGHLDQLIAVWEFRSGPTPWFVMTPKSGRSSQANR